jgi:hypothetical protein
MSPREIAVKARIEQFEDLTPPQDKTGKAGGTSATEPGTLAGDLATEVTNAVLNDFDSNAVFTVVKKRITDPDIIIKGKIQRFYAKAGPNALMWCTIPVDILWIFGMPIQEDEGMVQMELSIQRPDGTAVNTYSGQSEFSNTYTIYTNPLLAIGTKLNKAFGDAISQIRSKILADDERLAALASQPAEPDKKSKRRKAGQAKVATEQDEPQPEVKAPVLVQEQVLPPAEPPNPKKATKSNDDQL